MQQHLIAKLFIFEFQAERIRKLCNSSTKDFSFHFSVEEAIIDSLDLGFAFRLRGHDKEQTSRSN